MNISEGHKLRLILAFGSVYIIWGSTYLAILFAIQTIPPFLMAALRFFLAGLPLYIYARWESREIPTLQEWRSAMITGITMLLISNGGVTWAEQHVASGIS